MNYIEGITSRKIRTFLIDGIYIIYCIRIKDGEILIVHENVDKNNEVLSDKEFEYRYKIQY